MPWAGSHSWSWWVGFSVCLRCFPFSILSRSTMWWYRPQFGLRFSPVIFHVKVFHLRCKENWSFPEAHGSQRQGPRGRLRSNGPSRVKQGLGRLAADGCRGVDDGGRWRCLRGLLRHRGGAPNETGRRFDDSTIRRLDPDGGVSPGQDYGWGNELANYGEYSGAPSTEAGKTYENRYPRDFKRYVRYGRSKHNRFQAKWAGQIDDGM